MFKFAIGLFALWLFFYLAMVYGIGKYFDRKK